MKFSKNQPYVDALDCVQDCFSRAAFFKKKTGDATNSQNTQRRWRTEAVFPLYTRCNESIVGCAVRTGLFMHGMSFLILFQIAQYYREAAL